MKIIKTTTAVLLSCLLIAAALTGCTPKPEQLIIGKWTDSTGLTAYEFMEDRTVRFSLLGADVKAAYAIDKDAGTVTLTGTVLTKSFSKTYYFVVTDSTLTLTGVDSGDSAVYTRVIPVSATQ